MITDEQLNQKLEKLVTKEEFNSKLEVLTSGLSNLSSELKVLAREQVLLRDAVNKIHTMQVVLVGSLLGMTGLSVFAAIVKYLFFTQ